MYKLICLLFKFQNQQIHLHVDRSTTRNKKLQLNHFSTRYVQETKRILKAKNNQNKLNRFICY